jgi:hypothetical protein
MRSDAAVTVRAAMVIPAEGIGEIRIRAGRSEIRGYYDAERTVDSWIPYWDGKKIQDRTIGLEDLRRPAKEGGHYVHRSRAMAAAYRAFRLGKL